jgi:hypothetical protein
VPRRNLEEDDWRIASDDLDLAQHHDAVKARMADLMDALGAVDLVILGLGDPEFPDAAWRMKDADGTPAGPMCFTALGTATMKHFIGRGLGHLIGVNAASGPPFQGAFQLSYLQATQATVKSSQAGDHDQRRPAGSRPAGPVAAHVARRNPEPPPRSWFSGPLSRLWQRG